MLRNIIAAFLLLSLVFAPISALAHEVDELHEESTESAETVNSFELFWPLAAGKTLDDGFVYTLKTLKEKIRGLFIFGTAQKADYAVFLATKRVLEAEKLLNEDKRELADRILEAALGQLEVAEKNVTTTREAGANFGESGQEMVNRLKNINTLVTWLSTKEDLQNLDKVGERAVALANRLQ